jgi:UDP-N-acetylmuramate dehydrogenase
MKVLGNFPLKKYNTFGLNYTAERIVHIHNEADAIEALSKFNKSRLLIMGGGSNLLFTADFTGTIIKPDISGIKIEREEGSKVIISAGAGVNWDSFVQWTVDNNLYGLENLSLIPGDVGASPVQNIGAYGTEVRDHIEKVETISISNLSQRTFTKDECGFAYRYSIFKGREKGKYIVARVHFSLSASQTFNLEYGALREELGNKEQLTLSRVRQAVIDIRKRKLPDHAIAGNAGSFFKNPVLNESDAFKLKEQHPSLPVYPESDGFVKVAAGWLIEQCGWKGKRLGDAGVHEKQALVIVNYGNATGEEIFNLSELVKNSVHDKFGIKLEREVEIITPI